MRGGFMVYDQRLASVWQALAVAFGDTAGIAVGAARCLGQIGRAFILGPVAVVALAAPAHASTFTPPEGCTGTFTVQSRGCKLSNHFTCAHDAPGDQWRVDFGPFGAYFASRIDFETQWVHSVDMINGTVSRLMPGAPDPASFSELLETGTDTFDFNMMRGDGRMTRVTGFDTLTGNTLVVSGVTLQETAFEFSESLQDGTFLHGAKGNEYIWAERRLFFSGPSEWRDSEGEGLRDFSPAEIIFEGQEGFMITRPKYDCDVMMSGRAPSVLPAFYRLLPPAGK